MASSIKWRRVYNALKRKGMATSKAAAISNSMWNRKHGRAYRNTGRRNR